MYIYVINAYVYAIIRYDVTLTGPPKKHQDHKEFNRMYTVANQRFRDVQETSVFGESLEVHFEVVRRIAPWSFKSASSFYSNR